MNTFPIATAILPLFFFAAIEVWKFARRQDAPQQQQHQQQQHQQKEQRNSEKTYQDNLSGKGRRTGWTEVQPSQATQIWMAFVVTLVIGAAALYIILSKHYGQDDVKWAYGAVGTLLGYWLKR